MKEPGAWPAALLCGALLACQAPPSVVPGPVAATHCEAAGEVEHSIFLVGDAGAPRLPAHAEAELPVDPVLLALRSDVFEQVGQLGVDRVSVVYLGDNVYPRGLVPAGEASRRHGERVLRALITAASPARVVFVAGNHDWDIQGAHGWEHVRAQAAFLAQQGKRVAMLPPGGCAGPERIDFGTHLGMVLIDPIGFSHARDYPEVHAAVCPHATAREAFLALSAQFDAPSDRHLVLALHYPLITSGPHGGHFSWKQHIFPLTDFVPWLWLPLPLLGSVYPLARELGVTGTDVTHEAYRAWIQGIFRATRPGSPLLFASGHEHSLQLHRDGIGTYYAVSGAGSTRRVDRVEPLDTAMFALSAPGYMRLDSHANGALGLNVLVARDGEYSEPVLRHCLADGPASERVE
ncbi:MAG: hypothetical protein JRH16_03795 [Deltaproteobacteria bacterium]|nr:hypothetical protein [Deltaproteobacteria bacterium]